MKSDERGVGEDGMKSAEINIGVQATLKAALPTYSTFFDGSKMGLERGPFTTNEPLLMLRFCAQPAPITAGNAELRKCLTSGFHGTSLSLLSRGNDPETFWSRNILVKKHFVEVLFPLARLGYRIAPTLPY